MYRSNLKLSKSQKQHLYQLINSGITLTDKEALIVEDFLLSCQSQVTPYQLNSAKGLAMLRGVSR